MTVPWQWVDPAVVAALHDEQLADHGGLPGVQDPGAVASALARPENLAGEPDLADLAAAYAFGLARNHGFSDANKRTAWVVGRLFLRLNGAALRFDPAEAVLFMVDVARGALPETEMAAWFRQRLEHET